MGVLKLMTFEDSKEVLLFVNNNEINVLTITLNLNFRLKYQVWYYEIE